SDTGSRPFGVTGPALQGTLFGMVSVQSESGKYPDANGGGFLVTIDGTMYSAVTDSFGRWKIESLPAGDYTITISKDGYGTMKIYNYRFGRGAHGTWPYVFMGKLPDFDVESAATTMAGDTAIISGKLTNTSTDWRSVFMFLGKTNRVSQLPPDYFQVYGVEVLRNSDTYSGSIPASWLAHKGIVSGDTVFVAVYAASEHVISWTDPATQRDYFSPLSTTSQRIFFVVP
ncbi:MAG TPA: carboxypeptidase-like regulatory domain-containing protein, partial [Bacteroidota bacterium]|nr:carboxypeptidase-like regulatory domain-containing protein [Bacteroidota bacterium]